MKKLTSCLAFMLMIVLATASVLQCETIRATIVPSVARRPAPTFALLDAAGKSVSLSDFRGQPVLLNFWATDCGGCVLEIPTFVALDQAYEARGLVVLGISMDISYEDLKNSEDAWSKVRPFVSKHQVNYKILMGDSEVSKRYDIQALPVTQLIDRNGRVAATYVGIVNKENLETNIRAVLAER